jgi:hypothetical protein
LNQKPKYSRISGHDLARLCAFALCFLPTAATADDGAPGLAPGQGPRILEFHFTPVANAQLALWIEDADGEFKGTVALTEAVARRGIGNRPGASQMNSGFRWPYGRREGVLPVWAHQRLTQPGAKPFRTVIFQKRTSEGLASRTSEDYSRDDYFCLSFNNNNSKKDALDAISCASVFNSDKGRFITEQDVSQGYAEPYEDVNAPHQGRMRPLKLDSLYPPRRDTSSPCTGTACYIHPDVATYDAHVHEVMPEIDAVSMATPKGGEPQEKLFQVPSDWADGNYRACIEVNVEGDYNARYDDKHFPTPTTPTTSWDSWAVSYGYPYRGQPSVVYCVPFELQGAGESLHGVDEAIGSTATWDTAASSYGALAGMDGMSDDPVKAPGSGGDRLHLNERGNRFEVLVKPPVSCEGNHPPSQVKDFAVRHFPNVLHSHEWAELDFKAAADDTGVFRYDVRFSTQPIDDDDSFMRGQPAKAATVAAEELRVPTDMPAGALVRANIGGLVADTHYYVGVRAVDSCAANGELSVAEITTDRRTFQTVTPCFVATAAYGTPMTAEISALRRFRDRHLSNNTLGRLFVDAYYNVGPKLASVIRGHETLRAISRVLLAPAVAMARTLGD